MPDNRPPIPAEIERTLRQEAGFGCCVCGLPILEYHHIIPYSQCLTHNANDMMCLCPNHHAEADRATPQEEQRRWKAKPVNISGGHVDGLLKVYPKVLAIDAGTVQFIGDGCLARIDKRELLRLDLDNEGRILLTAHLLDKQNRPLVSIDRNQWQSGQPDLWDIRAGFQTLEVRQSHGEVALSIDATKDFIRFRGALWHNGALIRFTPSGIKYGAIPLNSAYQHIGRTAHVGLVKMTLAISTGSKMIAVVPTGPNGNGVVVLGATREERLREGIEKYHELMWKPALPSLEHLFPQDL